MEILDILILGSGPAALCLASELAKQDLNIKGISNLNPAGLIQKLNIMLQDRSLKLKYQVFPYYLINHVLIFFACTFFVYFV